MIGTELTRYWAALVLIRARGACCTKSGQQSESSVTLAVESRRTSDRRQGVVCTLKTVGLGDGCCCTRKLACGASCAVGCALRALVCSRKAGGAGHAIGIRPMSYVADAFFEISTSRGRARVDWARLAVTGPNRGRHQGVGARRAVGTRRDARGGLVRPRLAGEAGQSISRCREARVAPAPCQHVGARGRVRVVWALRACRRFSGRGSGGVFATAAQRAVVRAARVLVRAGGAGDAPAHVVARIPGPTEAEERADRVEAGGPGGAHRRASVCALIDVGARRAVAPKARIASAGVGSGCIGARRI